MSQNILNLLSGRKGRTLIDGISKNVGTTPVETQNVLQEALPGILGFMNQNAATPSGAASLVNALNSKHDGSILDSLGDFFGGGGNEQDGNGILNHILGGKKDSFAQSLSGRTGVNSSQVTKIIAQLAPIVMAYLGKQNQTKKSQGGSDLGGGIVDLLGSLLGGASGGGAASLGKGVSGMLDQNGDGKVGLDDLGGLLGGFVKKR